MRTFIEQLKTKIFEVSTILCFLLPPLGILLLFILSFVTIYKTWKDQRHLYFSLVSIFFLCLFISTIGAATQMKNISFLIDSLMILGYWGLYIRIMSNGNKDNFRYYRWIMIFGGIYNCLVGSITKWFALSPVIGFLTGTRLFGEITPKGYSRLIGSAYNPNFTMYLLLIAVALIFAEMLTNIRKKQLIALIWQLPILLVLSYGIIDTGSRAGYLAMICIYFLFFIRINKIIFITCSIFILSLSKQLFELMPRSELVNQSTIGRERIWMNTFELWKHHSIFGMTPLGFKNEYFNFFKQDMPHAHNILIGFFAEYGILGGVAFLTLLCTTLYKYVPLFYYKEKNNELLDSFLLSLPIIVLTGILDEPTFSPQITLLTIILLGYWNKYATKFTFPSLVFSTIKLKKIQKRNTSYENGFHYGAQNLK
jgi:O-antigen ligase